MSAQFIEINGERMAVLPAEEFGSMVATLEDRDDVAAADASDKRRQAGEEYLPFEMVQSLMEGRQHPLLLWRKYRGITQEELATAVGVSKMTVSGIETGKRGGSLAVLRKLADALSIELSDLIPEN